MQAEIKALVDGWAASQGAAVCVEVIDAQTALITMPAQDRRRDPIQLYVLTLPGGGLEITDGGKIMLDLIQQRVRVERTPDVLHRILQGTGVILQRCRLSIPTTHSNFNMALQRMLEVCLMMQSLHLIMPLALPVAGPAATKKTRRGKPANLMIGGDGK